MDYDPRNILTFRNVATGNNSVCDTNEEVTGYNDGTILCLLHKNGNLGAAYYSFGGKTLNIYEEISELAPQYLVSATIHREVFPKYLLTFGNITEEYVKVLIEFFTSDSDTTNTSTVSRLPDNFFLVSLKEYSYEACKVIVSNIKVASNILETSDPKQESYMRSCVNLNNRLSVQALGALYRYLEKHWSMFGVDSADAHFMHIYQVTLKNHVLMDNTTFKAFQIFSQRSHDAGFKRGQEWSSREGFSIYKLFLSGCKSKMGQIQLKNLLASPIKDKKELEKRLSFINFVLNTSNMDFIANIHDNIKQFKNVGDCIVILSKIQNGRASNREWKILHKMIYHTIYINEISKRYKEKSDLFVQLDEAITDDLLALQESIGNALDFNAGNRRGRPVIKFGLDENLDAKMLHQQDVAKHVTAAARFAVNDLPDYINECKVVYLPEMGHLMAIKEWDSNCDPDQLKYLGYQFIFAVGGIIHYKNPLCVELDKRLGDINAEIIDHENRILRRLSAFTVKYNKDIRDALKIVALMDSLIAIGKVCQQNNYVQPRLNEQNIHEILECRHPLMEQLLASFESNSYFSGGPHKGNMKIITGANGSGKSIFLKQIALAVYLAHVGCYVPAEKANIGLVDSIHCRIQTRDTAVVRLSSFMMDITKTGQALQYATPRSLIVLDEFGRGTLDDDGLVLLACFLKLFLSKGSLCPHILVSTHLQRIASLLEQSDYLEYLKMDHAMENGAFCFLHKISRGISNSFAFDIASTIFGEERMDVARKYFKCLQHIEPVQIPECTMRLHEKLMSEDIVQPEMMPDEEQQVQEDDEVGSSTF